MSKFDYSTETQNHINQTRQITRAVEGWLTEKEGKFLYKMASQCIGYGVIVEIGSWKGRSTIWLAQGSKYGNQVKVYAIDPHTGSPEHRSLHKKIWTFDIFKKNLQKAQVTHLVTPLVTTSETAVRHWNLPIEFLFIDGAHEYEFVKKDFLLWFPYIVDNGIIAIHDTTACLTGENFGWSGPRQVANIYLFNSPKFCKAGIVDTITYAVKCKSSTRKNRLQVSLVRIFKFIPDLIQIFASGSISILKNVLGKM